MQCLCRLCIIILLVQQFCIDVLWHSAAMPKTPFITYNGTKDPIYSRGYDLNQAWGYAPKRHLFRLVERNERPVVCFVLLQYLGRFWLTFLTEALTKLRKMLSRKKLSDVRLGSY